jgi:hypothetical protein
LASSIVSVGAAMASETLLYPAALLKVQSIRELGVANVLIAVLAVTAAALAVDYSYMLYLRSRMVSCLFGHPLI